MKITAPFSYYGGKSKLAHLYPPPQHDTIIEPFAGGASYSFRYYDRNVLLNDLDEYTYAIWCFLVSPNAADCVERLVPAHVEPGQRISDFDIPNLGLQLLLRAEANQGTQGAKGCRDQITMRGAVIWNRGLKRKLLEYVIPRVAHWRVMRNDYSAIPNQKATWFIDPPYQNAAGASYRTNCVDFQHLAQWCKERKGQVMVCENAGATWLPFEPIAERRGFFSSYQKSRAIEVLWSQEST